MKKLFSDFAPSSAYEWKQQIVKDLKGADFEKLVWQNANGFSIDPFYTSETRIEKPQPLFAHPDWEICVKIIADDEKAANKAALKASNGGASGLIFILNKKTDLEELLHEVSVKHIELNF